MESNELDSLSATVVAENLSEVSRTNDLLCVSAIVCGEIFEIQTTLKRFSMLIQI